MKNIIISSITGLTPPFEIYICDFLGNRCQYVKTEVSAIPPIDVIPLPDIFSGAPAVTLIVKELTTLCQKEIPVVCTQLPNVFSTFCNCADTSVCLYTDNITFLNFGDVVSLNNFGLCWIFSGYQFTTESSLNLIPVSQRFSNCQQCYDSFAPTYFSACCSNYTFTFNSSYQDTFEPNTAWYLELPPSTSGTGTGYTGCTVVIANYETPDQTYVQADWNNLTNTNSSPVYPFPRLYSCDDCTEINSC
jgi:hypothetical protein